MQHLITTTMHLEMPSTRYCDVMWLLSVILCNHSQCRIRVSKLWFQCLFKGQIKITNLQWSTEYNKPRFLSSSYSNKFSKCILEICFTLNWQWQIWLQNLKEDADNEFLKLLRATIKCLTYPEKYFEKLLRLAIKKIGTDEWALTRVVTTRAEVDMERIKEEYRRRNSVTLDHDIAGEASGDYERMLLALIGHGDAWHFLWMRKSCALYECCLCCFCWTQSSRRELLSLLLCIAYFEYLREMFCASLLA